MLLIMKNNILLVVFIIAVILSFSSCAPAYVPNVVNAPLLSNKGELHLAAYAGTSGSDFQVAVAPTKNIGVMINGSFKNKVSDTSNNYNKHNFVECALGYYTTFDNSGHFEIFGGYGYGIADIKNTVDVLGQSSTVQTNATYQKIFLQPNIGASFEMMDFAFSPRLVVVDIKPDYLQYTTKTKAFFEPTATMRLGFKYLYLSSQLGFSIPLTKIDSGDWLEYQPLIFSLGIYVKLGKIYNMNARYNR